MLFQILLIIPGQIGINGYKNVKSRFFEEPKKWKKDYNCLPKKSKNKETK
jgi:hypothetical protein